MEETKQIDSSHQFTSKIPENEKLKDSKSIDTSISKSTESKEMNQTDFSQEIPNELTGYNHNASMNKSIQKDQPQAEDFQEIQDSEVNEKLTIMNESKNTIKDTFISELFEKRETIMKILNDYEETGTLSLADIKLEKPFKIASFSLMERTLKDFIQACGNIEISQRKAVHIALNDFIWKYGEKKTETYKI